jgi:hypothetical protein
MLKPMERLQVLKKFPDRSERTRARQRPRAGRDRTLVRRRSQDRPEEQDHPPLGQTRHAAVGAARSTDGVGLYLRRHLPQGRQGCSPSFASVQYRYDEPSSGRDRNSNYARSSCSSPGRPSRLAPVTAPRRADEYHDHSTATEMPRTQSG